MTSAVTDYGTLLKRSGSTIAEVINVSIPKRSNAAMDATSHSSGGVAEFISAMLLRMAAFNATVNFISDATQDSLYADIAAGTAVAISIVLPGSMGTFAGNALITEFQGPQGADAKNPKPQQGQFTIQPTGAWTLT